MTEYTIVEPGFEFIDPPNETNYLEFLEKCTRCCYKSEGLIKPGSAEKLMTKVVKEYEHYSVTEHANCIIGVRYPFLEKDIRQANPLLRVTNHPQCLLVSGNIRMWKDALANGTPYMREQFSYPLAHKFPFFFKEEGVYEGTCNLIDENPLTNNDNLTPEELEQHTTLTCKIIGDRSMSHQLVRHRLFAFSQECLSGDTFIQRYSNSRKNLTIKELYDRQQDPQLTGRNKLMKLRSMNDQNVIVPNKMVKVFQSGIKEVFEMKTKLGYSIKTSENHVFFNKEGEVLLKSVSVGDKIWVNGIEVYKDKEWFKEKYENGLSTTDIAKLCNIAPCTARVWKRKHGIKTDTKYKSHTAWNKGIKEGEHSSVDRQANSLRKNHHNNGFGSKNSQWKHDISELTVSGKRLRFYKHLKECCELCGDSSRLQNHHKDENIDNWHESNKMTLCDLCHKLVHKGYVVKKAILDEVVSIKYVGKEMTYDIEMEEPYHNFVANGFVVHNSQRYCNYGKKGFQFVVPPSVSSEAPRGYKTNRDIFIDNALEAYEHYLQLLGDGIPPEDARGLLPNCTKTEVVTTGTLGYWKHVFEHRAHNPKAQWQIREIMLGVEKKFKELLPEVF